MPNRLLTTRWFLACWLTSGIAAAAPQTQALAAEQPTKGALPKEIAPTPTVVLPRVGDYRRAALHVDPIEAAVARGDWPAPLVGDKVVSAEGKGIMWREATASPTPDLAGGYAYAEFDSTANRVMLLDCRGAAAVWLNGVWMPGDPYAVGWFRPPLLVAEGKNRLLVHRARPTAQPRLVQPADDFVWLTDAATLPDFVAPGKASAAEPVVLSVPLMNATTSPLSDARLRVRWGDGEPVVTPLRHVDPLLITPVTIELPPPAEVPTDAASVSLRIEVLPKAREQPSNEEVEPIAVSQVTLRVVSNEVLRTDTFVSAVDGSVQAYGVLPARDASGEAATVIVLHDAGETPTSCLKRYQPRPGVHFVAPGGRGRWAFDGEDWSRKDALETLADFERRQKLREQPIDQERVSLLGRGMGGHAALHLATLRPASFSALGVIDGWLSFYTQGGARVAPADATPITRLLARQPASNDPLQTIENLRGVGVSVLVTEDGRVSPSEGRYVRERLGRFHNDFSYREPTDSMPEARLLEEQIGWLTSRRCPTYDDADEIDFATPDLNATSQLGWVTILAVDPQGTVARVRIRRDRLRREVVGATENVRRLRLSLEAFGSGEKVAVRLDGGKSITFKPGRDGDQLALARDEEGVWRRVPDGERPMSRVASMFKTPQRSGGLKSVFCCRPLLVYGTRGGEAEQQWAAAKARYDAHLFLYRGAGRLEVLPDTVFRQTLQSATTDLDRSVVLYGNARTNSAWTVLQQEAFLRRSRTIRVDTDQAWLGSRPEAGDALSVLGLRPRPGSRQASIGIVGGTGVVGMRMTTRLRYFWSGVSYPDYLLFGPKAIDSPSRPSSATDVRAAGYFDADWGTEGGGILWRDLAI